ncbi:MAG TPA: hypothetical protein VEC99_18835 [Clostridia bacterium]|nr:hypothetical protein [Clostridia bacterium]
MRKLLGNAILLGLIALGISLANRADAALDIKYKVGGGECQIVGTDLVQLYGGNWSIKLEPGQSKVGKVNTLNWFILTDWVNDSETWSWDRTMTVSAVVGSQTLSQDTTLIVRRCRPDTLTLSAGDTVEFNLGNYILKVTPLAQELKMCGGLTCDTFDINANFELVPVPEPTTIVAGALLLIPFGASTLRVVRRKRS